jgi:hypothetical protein
LCRCSKLPTFNAMIRAISGVSALLFAAAIASASTAAAMPGVPPDGAMVFSVRKSGSEVGTHRITFAERDGALVVETDSKLQLRLAFVTVYRYVQRTREIWRDGVLVGIESDIDDNGTPFRLRGVAKDGVLRLDGHQETHAVPVGIKPLSYWNVAVMRAPRGFDVQWGSLADLAVESRGAETRQVAGKPVEARRYAMRGYEIRKGERQKQPWLNLDAWYDREDRLVGLAFHYRGFDFDYIRQQ